MSNRHGLNFVFVGLFDFEDTSTRRRLPVGFNRGIEEGSRLTVTNILYKLVTMKNVPAPIVLRTRVSVKDTVTVCSVYQTLILIEEI
jgi:hypothetical protein